MSPSLALALIRPRQLLSAIFTVYFHVHALQMESVIVLSTSAIAYDIPIIYPPAKHRKH